MIKIIIKLVCLICLIFTNCNKSSEIKLGEVYRLLENEKHDDKSIVFSKKLAIWNNIGYNYFIEDGKVNIKYMSGYYPFEIINNNLIFNPTNNEYYAIINDDDFTNDKYKDKFIGRWIVFGETFISTIDFFPDGNCNKEDVTGFNYEVSSKILRIFKTSLSEKKEISEYYYFIQNNKIILKTSRDINLTLVEYNLALQDYKLTYETHVVKIGDNISNLAVNYGLNQDTILSVNKVANSRSLQIGKVLKIPNKDGIIYTIRNNDNLNSISQRFNVDKDDIQLVNEIFSENVLVGTELFIPGARLSVAMLQEFTGDLFSRPLYGDIISYYGRRRDPINPDQTEFHSGIDIRGVTGSPVRSAMAGRVSSVGYDNIYGNYVIINHHSGYRTLYGHLSVIRTRAGANVAQGERIGDVGSTGQVTEPQLHFTVYKNGVLVNPLNLMR